MQPFAHVLSPMRIGALELRNRVVRTAYGTNLGRGQLTDELIAHHEARARGGVALSIVEATGVHRSGPMTLNGADDSIVPRYAALARGVHAHGMKIFGQLNHLGLAGPAHGERPWSASAIVSPTGQRALAMSAAQIDEIVTAFANAARRVRDGGLDGVEIHCAHGHLLQQFLSVWTNLREDRYGGDWDGRLRLLLEVVTACRQAVGRDFILGVRIGPEPERMRLTATDCARAVEELERHALIDYLSVSQGSIYVPEKIIGAMHEPAGYELEQSRQITAATTLPTIVTGRIRTLAEADEIVRQGISDLVGMTRAHIADPDLIAKTLTGRAAAVRPCIACNQGCVGGLERGRLACTVNAAAGREQSVARSPAVTRRQRVIVIGGGPAGLEAARVAALRGHRVSLIEATTKLGGTLQIARRAPHHQLIGEIADWLAAEVRALDVDIVLGRPAEAAMLAEPPGDVVLIATGAMPDPELPRLARSAGDDPHAPRLMTARELLGAAAAPAADTAVVFDQSGGYEAIGAAEWLIEQGVAVTFVTGFSRFAPRLESALVSRPALQRLRRGEFALLTNAEVLELGPSSCRVESTVGRLTELPAELLVIAAPGSPDDRLIAAARNARQRVITIGEARLPGMTLERAIHDAHDVAMRLGT